MAVLLVSFMSVSPVCDASSQVVVGGLLTFHDAHGTMHREGSAEK
jgi:hypothetical protein